MPLIWSSQHLILVYLLRPLLSKELTWPEAAESWVLSELSPDFLMGPRSPAAAHALLDASSDTSCFKHDVNPTITYFYLGVLYLREMVKPYKAHDATHLESQCSRN